MSKTIESTVEKLPQDLAKAGVMGSQHVFVTVLDDEEAARLAELRHLMTEARQSGDYIDGEEAFAQLRADLVEKHPELADATHKS